MLRSLKKIFDRVIMGLSNLITTIINWASILYVLNFSFSSNSSLRYLAKVSVTID